MKAPLQIGFYRALIKGEDYALLARLSRAEAKRKEEREAKKYPSHPEFGPSEPSLQTGFGGEAEQRIFSFLNENGVRAQRMPYQHSFDILIEGLLRLEVKTSHRREDNTWHFNIHHGGVLNEKCDLYALELYGTGRYALREAPIGKPIVRIAENRVAHLLTPEGLSKRILKKVLDF